MQLVYEENYYLHTLSVLQLIAQRGSASNANSETSWPRSGYRGPSIDACTGVGPRRRIRSPAFFVSSFNELQRVSVQSWQSTHVGLALPRESHGLSLAAKERDGLMARCQMTMPGTIVFMRLPQLDSDEIQLTMTHAPFGDDLLGELPNFLRGTL